MFSGHSNIIFVADDFPGRFFTAHRIVELAVFEHLGPDAAINAPAEMFDKLAVYVLRYRLFSLMHIDLNCRPAPRGQILPASGGLTICVGLALLETRSKANANY
jgi:hypothetical protein